MAVRLGWTHYHTFVSHFRVFQVSTISRVFDGGDETWILLCLTNEAVKRVRYHEKLRSTSPVV